MGFARLMTRRFKFRDCSTCSTLAQDVGSRGVCVREEGTWDFSVLYAQFRCESKIALKNEVDFLKTSDAGGTQLATLPWAFKSGVQGQGHTACFPVYFGMGGPIHPHSVSLI